MEYINQTDLLLQTIVLKVEDTPGTLFLVSSIFSNRGLSIKNIQLLNDYQDNRCSTLSISFNSEDSRKNIIIRLLARLDCVIDCQ